MVSLPAVIIPPALDQGQVFITIGLLGRKQLSSFRRIT